MLESLGAAGQLVRVPAESKGDRRPLVMQVGWGSRGYAVALVLNVRRHLGAASTARRSGSQHCASSHCRRTGTC